MEIDREAILQTYLAESEEHLGQMEEALVALETHPEDEKLLEAIFRGAHTIKGNSSSLGFPRVAEFAHAFEELLQRFRSRTVPVTRELITLLLQSVDALRQMVPQAVADVEEIRPEHTAILWQLAERTSAASKEELAPGPDVANRRARPWGRRQEDIQAWAERAGTIRVDVEKLDRMLNLVGEIAIARERLTEMMAKGVGRTEIQEARLGIDTLFMQFQELVMKVRMVPVGPIFRQYIRTVRDLAQGLGKVARLAIEGEDVEVDMSVVEHLKDPLTHIIRNALDHGIETPEVRRARGKDPLGLLTLRASHQGGSIVIQVGDDGAGLNRDRIVERARSLGTIAEPEKLADQELYRLVFKPGFSTAEAVTDLSGRGVGMDIVLRNVEALRGSVAVESHPGEGTTITLRLPLTLAIIEGFGVGVGDETYVLPLHAVIECMDLPAEARHQGNGSGVINLRGEPLPYLRLRDWFALPGPCPARENIVVVEQDGARAGLAVDILYGESQTVIKPLGTHLQGLPGIAGSTILGNGRVALILDIPSLLREVIQAQGMISHAGETHRAL